MDPALKAALEKVEATKLLSDATLHKINKINSKLSSSKFLSMGVKSGNRLYELYNKSIALQTELKK